MERLLLGKDNNVNFPHSYDDEGRIVEVCIYPCYVKSDGKCGNWI